MIYSQNNQLLSFNLFTFIKQEVQHQPRKPCKINKTVIPTYAFRFRHPALSNVWLAEAKRSASLHKANSVSKRRECLAKCDSKARTLNRTDSPKNHENARPSQSTDKPAKRHSNANPAISAQKNDSTKKKQRASPFQARLIFKLNDNFCLHIHNNIVTLLSI